MLSVGSLEEPGNDGRGRLSSVGPSKIARSGEYMDTFMALLENPSRSIRSITAVGSRKSSFQIAGKTNDELVQMDPAIVVVLGVSYLRQALVGNNTRPELALPEAKSDVAAIRTLWDAQKSQKK